MNKKFEIFGHFYERSGVKCRSDLDIRREGETLGQPDLMVVMMNRGSSYPLDGRDNNHAASEAHPDPTQDQIMTVMSHKGFKFARVLNLSDARQPTSKKLYRFLNSSNARSFPHSIFHQLRIEELNTLFRKGVPVIYGWGVNAKLQVLARMAMNRIAVKNPIGIRKAGIEWAYYHPLPRIHAKQVEWVDAISSLL